MDDDMAYPIQGARLGNLTAPGLLFFPQFFPVFFVCRLAEVKSMEMDDLREAFEVPRELASAMEQLDSQQMKRSVELMGQCVQVGVVAGTTEVAVRGYFAA